MTSLVIGRQRHAFLIILAYYNSVSTISYKSLKRISPYLQLRCSWGPRWND